MSIKQSHLLIEIDKKLGDALKLIAYQLQYRKGMDLQIINPYTSEEMSDALIKQGGKLDQVNKARKKAGLSPLSETSNLKVFDKSFTGNLKAENDRSQGVIFTLGYNLTRSLVTERSKAFIKELIKNSKVDFKEFNNKLYSVFYIGIPQKEKAKKAKDEPHQDEPGDAEKK